MIEDTPVQEPEPYIPSIEFEEDHGADLDRILHIAGALLASGHYTFREEGQRPYIIAGRTDCKFDYQVVADAIAVVEDAKYSFTRDRYSGELEYDLEIARRDADEKALRFNIERQRRI